MSRSTFAARVRELRLSAACTQENFATLVGTSAETVARWESGRVQPTVASLVAIADELNVETDWLLGRTYR